VPRRGNSFWIGFGRDDGTPCTAALPRASLPSHRGGGHGGAADNTAARRVALVPPPKRPAELLRLAEDVDVRADLPEQ